MDTRRRALALLFAAMTGGVLSAQPVFKTVTLGDYPSAAALAQAMDARGMGASNRAISILKTMAVSPVSAQLDLVVVSVGELGLPDRSKFADIVARARKRGLDLCPGEVGPTLRLQYANQLEDDTLRIAMEPVMTGTPPVPTVFRLSGKSLLAVDIGNPFDKSIRWVFARR